MYLFKIDEKYSIGRSILNSKDRLARVTNYFFVMLTTTSNNKIYNEDLNSHLLTLTQLAEESTALTVCPFGQKVRRGGDYLSHTLTIAIHLS